jgi:hypothetical protein
MTEAEAQELLDDALTEHGQGPASTFSFETRPNEDARARDWWHANMKPSESSVTQRSLGYLLGYARIAGNGLLTASGLPLDDGFLWMDRSVMKRFDRDGYLRWAGPITEPHFEITPKGALLFRNEIA